MRICINSNCKVNAHWITSFCKWLLFASFTECRIYKIGDLSRKVNQILEKWTKLEKTWFCFLQLNEEKWRILKNHFCSVFSKFNSNTPFLVQIKYRDQISILVAKFRVFTFQSRPVNALYNPTDHMKLYTELLHRPFRKYTRRNMFFSSHTIEPISLHNFLLK